MARSDAIGMFWQDLPTSRVRGEIIRPMPPIPNTGWEPPTYFPDLSREKIISIDCETYDPELEDNGPGWARGVGHIVGVSVGVISGHRWYFPMRHTIEPEYNLDPEHVLAWLADSLGNKKQFKVGANLGYDVGWLRQEGVIVRGELLDVQFAEALLSEGARVNLEALSQKYLNEGKDSNLLYQWCADFYGGQATPKQRKNIYRTPARLTGPYAESDADLPLRLINILYALLEKEGMLDLFRMECGLIYLMNEMRFAGVSVNVEAAEKLKEILLIKEKEENLKLEEIAGVGVNIDSGASLAIAFDNLGINYPKTELGNPSFTKQFLAGLKHPISDIISEIRKLAKLRGTFVESYILDSHINGKVYGQFHLLRGDESGTRSGRLSSSTPNLQNIPSRDDILAPLVRGLFIPDYGHKQWRKYDYSQIEYRFLVHFAIGEGAEEARNLFRTVPSTDYHEMALDMVAPQAGWDISTKELRKFHRRPIKNINFGLIYGMGVDKLAGDLGLDRKQGKALFAAYHKGVPFAKATMDAASEEAKLIGVITTILGRKSRFDLWERDSWGRDGEEGFALPYEDAILKYGRIKRAYTHKALNRRLQGSAADMMKKAMLQAWEDGVFDETGVPRLTVHDELDFSDPGDKDDAFAELKRILENAIPLKIPVRADCDIGPDWGHVEQI